MSDCTCTTDGHCAACQPQREAQWKAPTGYIAEKAEAISRLVTGGGTTESRDILEQARFYAECIVVEANRWLGDEDVEGVAV